MGEKKGNGEKALRFYHGYSKEAEYETDLSKWQWVVLKFIIYGCLGMVIEIFFTNIVRLATQMSGIGTIVSSFSGMSFPEGIPDQIVFPWQFFFAMSSTWMIMVYGSGFFLLEATYAYLKKMEVPLLLRGLAYSIIILFVEFAWGWIYRLILGDFIWQYKGILVTTTFAILPYWYVASLVFEVVLKKMHEKDVEYAFRTNYNIPLPEFDEKKHC